MVLMPVVVVITMLAIVAVRALPRHHARNIEDIAVCRPVYRVKFVVGQVGQNDTFEGTSVRGGTGKYSLRLSCHGRLAAAAS